jgi:hypothetical protein
MKPTYTFGPHGVARLDEAFRAFEFFRREGTPIDQWQARRMAFLDWQVATRRLSEFPDWERPRRFVSRDPRRGGWVS